jgi:hypothetical protein
VGIISSGLIFQKSIQGINFIYCLQTLRYWISDYFNNDIRHHQIGHRFSSIGRDRFDVYLQQIEKSLLI